MGYRQDVNTALTGVDTSRAAAFAGMGIDPAAFKALRAKRTQEAAVRHAKSKGGLNITQRISTGVSNAGLTLATTGNPYAAASAGIEGTIRDPQNDPAALREARLTQPLGPTAERAQQNRDELNGRDTPGWLATSNAVASKFPGRAPMVQGNGRFDPRAAGINAVSAALSALGIVYAGPAATAGGFAGGEAAGAIADAHAKNPYVNMGARVAGSVVGGGIGGALDPNFKPPVSSGWEALDKTLNAPGAWFRPTGTGAGATIGRSAVNAFPTVGSQSVSVLSRLQAMQAARQRAKLMAAFGAPAPQPVDLLGQLHQSNPSLFG